MADDVVDELVLEILKTRGIKERIGKPRLFNLSSIIACRPYKYDEKTKKFQSSGNNKITKVHSILVIGIAVFTFVNVFLKKEGFESFLISSVGRKAIKQPFIFAFLLSCCFHAFFAVFRRFFAFFPYFCLFPLFLLLSI